MDSNIEDQLSAAREARLKQTTSALFESLERYELQECLSFSQYHWMLSTDEYKIPTEPPNGIISQLTPLKSSHGWILVPEEASLPEKLDFRVVHQITRELTMGIFILNQIPMISLEANFDCSTSVQLPPAYIDTKVGQLLTNVDYLMKCLWHGSYIPRDKRIKFADRWRKKLDVNMETGKAESKSPHIMDFHGAGMIDITKIREYATVYDAIPVDQPDDVEAQEDRRFFMSHADNLTIRMFLSQRSIKMYKNMFLVDGDWIISSIVKLTEDKIDQIGYERLQSRLRVQKNVIKNNLMNKDDVRQQLWLLKFVSFMVPFLCAMRRKMQIPDLSRLLPPMLGDAVKTERELPPLMTGDGYVCKNFSYSDTMFSLHGGILMDLETPDPSPLDPALVEQYDHMIQQCEKLNDRALDVEAPHQETYEVPTCEVDGKRYYLVKIEFDTYYPQPPRKPKWLQALVESVDALKPRKLPIQEPQMMDVYKKLYGYRRALKFKNAPVGLKAAAQRGLVAIFSELARKSQISQLMKQDEAGLSLIHHAAINNRPQIIATLILKSMDVNARRNQSVLSIVKQMNDSDDELRDELLPGPSSLAVVSSDEYISPRYANQGPTALHLAARCGSLDAVACLCANYANILVIDQNGWAPIHHAAFYDHVPIIKMLVRKHDSMLELLTQNEVKNTPLLLAASSGALEAVGCLISLGAAIHHKNENGNNLIHLASLRFHTNVLEYFIKNKHEGIEVWSVLVEMLKDSDLTKQDAAVRCLEVLSLSDKDHWVSILEHEGIPALVKLLQSERTDIQSLTASVLCNVSEQDAIRKELAAAGASKILISLLGSPVDDIQSRASIILSDIASVGNNQTHIAALGVTAPLVNLLNSELEDVLVNAVNAIRVLCNGNPANQAEFAKQGALEPLVEFLSAADSDILQAAAAAALCSLCTGNKENQMAISRAGACRPLVTLTDVASKNFTVQMKASSCIEAMCTDNPENQTIFLDLDAPKNLIRLLKTFSPEIKERGACALWAIAGHTKPQQRMLAERIGTTQIIDMLMQKSESLKYVGGMTLIALCRENVEKQNKICEEGGIEPLVRLVKWASSERVLITAIKALGILCIGVAHRNNKKTQHRIADGNALPVLVGHLLNPTSQFIQVEVACSLACIVLGNVENQEKLKQVPSFKYSMLLKLLLASNQNIRLQAGTALATFAFNNPPQQYAMREAGGVSYDVWKPFLESDDEFYKAYASFQIVILARVIVDRDQVSLTAQGVTQLVELLKSKVDNVVILAASLLSSLAHTRAGIPDAMITSGALEILIGHLSSPHTLLRTSCAVCIGYLSFNKTAARKLLSSCRNQPDLYDLIFANIDSEAKISEEFVKDFERARKIGLPTQSLEINGGPPVCPPKREGTSIKGSARPKTSSSRVQERDSGSNILKRAISAPAKVRAHTSVNRLPRSYTGA